MNMFNRGNTQPPIPNDDSGGLKEMKQKMRTPAGSAPAASRGDDTPNSLIGKDLNILGNLDTKGNLVIEGRVQGDVNAKVLTVGMNAEVKGQLKAEEMIVNGRIIGEVRGNKVRLNKSARVDGDVIHETLSVEAGAYFEGSVRRTENPLEGGRGGKAMDTAKPQGDQKPPRQPGVKNIPPERI